MRNIRLKPAFLFLCCCPVLIYLTYIGAWRFLGPTFLEGTHRKLAKWDGLYQAGMEAMQFERFADAERIFLESLEYAKTTLFPQPLYVESSAYALGGLYLVQRRFDDARIYFEESLRVLEQMHGTNAVELSPALHRLAEVYIELGEADTAMEYAHRDLSIRESQYGEQSDELLEPLRMLAKAYEIKGDDFGALQMRMHLIKIHEHLLTKCSVDYASALRDLALTYEVRKEDDTARRLLERSLAVLEEHAAKDDPNIVRIKEEYKRLLRAEAKLRKPN